MMVLVRGVGDVGSAVAHNLFLAGHQVVLHDLPLPTTTRRGMAFADAVFEGTAVLDGVIAQRVENVESVSASSMILVLVSVELELVLAQLRSTILNDARMRKRTQPESQRHLAPLTIGLGPNFIAQESVDFVIETQRGPQLGAVIRHGSVAALAGEPMELGRYARQRYVYASLAGLFLTTRQIGDHVRRGEIVARIETTPLYAPLDGMLRGLTHDRVPVTLDTKVIEVDPRCELQYVHGIGERPRRIAEGVAKAIQVWNREQDQLSHKG